MAFETVMFLFIDFVAVIVMISSVGIQVFREATVFDAANWIVLRLLLALSG